MAPRLPEEPHVNIEVRGEASVEAMEKKLLDEITSRNKDGKIEVHKDAGFAENPMDREDITGVALNTGEKALILMASISRDHCGGSGQGLLQHPGRPQGDILPRPEHGAGPLQVPLLPPPPLLAGLLIISVSASRGPCRSLTLMSLSRLSALRTLPPPR